MDEKTIPHSTFLANQSQAEGSKTRPGKPGGMISITAPFSNSRMIVFLSSAWACVTWLPTRRL